MGPVDVTAGTLGVSVTAVTTAPLTDPTLNELRQVTQAALIACLLVAGAVLVVFWVVLHPVDAGRCNTSLLASPFKSALAPVHLVAAAVLSGCVWMMSALRRGRALPGKLTLGGLGVVWAWVMASIADPELINLAVLVGVFAAPTVGLLALIALAVRAHRTRTSAQPAEVKWRDHARTTQILLWGALLIGLPANLGYAYMRGADLFCF